MPEGPHFTWTFYQTFSGVVQTLFGLIGTVVFQHLVTQWSLRRVFWISIAWRVAASVVDLCLVKRWNLLLGVNDHIWYMLGVNVVSVLAEQIEFMAGVILMSKLCPKSVETTVYAILAGFSNFGNMIASSFGIFLIHMSGIVTTESAEKGRCDFESLPSLILFGHFFLPLLGIPLSFALIPNVMATDSFIEEMGLKREKKVEDVEMVGLVEEEDGSESESGNGEEREEVFTETMVDLVEEEEGDAF